MNRVPTRHSEGWLLPVAVVMIGSFMAVLDTSIVNVAIPTMQVELGAAADQVLWVATGYTLGLGVVVPLSGWLADRYGLDRVLNAALALFVAGSALCGLATSIQEMIVFRIVQAAGGGLLPAVSQAMVYRIVPRERIGTAMGVFGLGVIFAPAIGPTLGGWLVEYVSWRLIYFINVPIGIAAIALSLMVLPRFPTVSGQRLDLLGWLTVSAGLFALLLACSEGERWHWDSYGIRLLLLLGVTCLAIFVVVELSVEQPMLDLRVFRSPAFSISAVLIAVLVIGLFASLYFIPLFLQQAQGLGPFETGLTLLPPALVTVVMMPLSGWLFDRIGARWPVAIGVLLVALASYLMHSIAVETPRATIMGWMAIRNLGMGLSFMPLMAAAMSTLPTALVVRASAMQNIIQRVAGALGLAVLGSILAQHQAQQFADRAALLPAVDPGFPLLQQIASQGRAGVLLLYSVLQVHVFAGALGDVFLLTAGITALGAPLALMLPDRTARRAAAPMPVAAAGAVPAAVASADPEGGADGAVPLDAAWIPAPWSQEPVGHGRSPGRRRVERHRRRRSKDRVEGADQRGAAPDEGVVEQPLAGAGRRRR
ncbi:MAG TPA: DHA2 family efflux MFS transporter permease subunit [Candidatus Dormibacteraeota bacterium]